MANASASTDPDAPDGVSRPTADQTTGGLFSGIALRVAGAIALMVAVGLFIELLMEFGVLNDTAMNNVLVGIAFSFALLTAVVAVLAVVVTLVKRAF
ncbi:hypothetical protein [Halomarina ordinaria]|uniref:Uncharacterized protein n=1 Tax=Halomarina ordinaria TaxID=3033939 RepID=A0ABD5UD73_9EURY|nr:hypothetical protein [Halomarina sp. PSRA2]